MLLRPLLHAKFFLQIVPDLLPNNGKSLLPEAERANLFSAGDVVGIANENNWLGGDPDEKHLAWCAHAAAILGPQVIDRVALADLLRLVFEYDPRAILRTTEAHVVMSRYAARDVLRQLALLLLEGVPLTSERFSEIITRLKEGLDIRGRELFHPIRLALAGRSGEGELDRVILLLEEAAAAGFAAPVKTARERILAFCSVFE